MFFLDKILQMCSFSYMTEAQIQDELDAIHECRMAIYKTGASYSRTGLQLTRASLTQMAAEEKELKKQLMILKGNRSFVMDVS